MVSGLTGAAEQDLSPRYKDPVENYSKVELQGWTLLVNRRLKEHPDVRRDALDTFEWQLQTIKRIVPPHATKVMQGVTIWLEYDCVAAAQYHPERDWLVENGYHPAKAKCIDVGDVRRYIGERGNEPVMVLLHELVHAYHDQALGFDDERVVAAFEKSRKTGGYDEVLHDRRERVRHYALTNHKEWFAEISESYLWVNDYFPFNRAELRKSDPEAFRFMASVWSRAAEPAKGGRNTEPTSPRTDGPQ